MLFRISLCLLIILGYNTLSSRAAEMLSVRDEGALPTNSKPISIYTNYSDLVLYTNDFAKSEIEIKSLGAKITHKLSGMVFIVQVPVSLKIEEKLKTCSLTPPTELDASTQMMVKAWGNLKNTTYKRPPPDLTSDNKFACGKRTTPDKQPDTSLAMTGKIVCGLFIVSGKNTRGVDFSFDNLEQEKIATQVVDATINLQRMAGLSEDITFIIETFKPSIIADQAMSKENTEITEGPWRNAALKEVFKERNIPYPGDSQPGDEIIKNVSEFIKYLISSTNAKWGYLAFFTKYPVINFGEYGYHEGQRLVIQYKKDFVLENLTQIFAHETCHLFGAEDEYNHPLDPTSKCTCEPKGYYKVPNMNCVNCPDKTEGHVPCLMDENALAMCRFTRGQLGWPFWHTYTQMPFLNIVGDGAPSMVAWKKRLYFSFVDGIQYLLESAALDDGGTPVESTKRFRIVKSPAVIDFNDKLLLAYHEWDQDHFYEGNGRLFVTLSHDGLNWPIGSRIPNVEIAESPALCKFKVDGKFYLAHQGSSYAKPTGGLYYTSSEDGVVWNSPRDSTVSTENIQIKTKMTGSPAIAEFNNMLYIAYQARDNPGSIYYTRSNDGKHWSNARSKEVGVVEAVIPNVRMYGSPALATYKSRLYLVFRGAGDSKFKPFYSSSTDGVDWDEVKPVPFDKQMFGDPGLAEFNGKLYLMHQTTGKTITEVGYTTLTSYQ